MNHLPCPDAINTLQDTPEEIKTAVQVASRLLYLRLEEPEHCRSLLPPLRTVRAERRAQPLRSQAGCAATRCVGNMLLVNGDPLQNSELLKDYERNAVVIGKNVQVWKNILSNSELS